MERTGKVLGQYQKRLEKAPGKFWQGTRKVLEKHKESSLKETGTGNFLKSTGKAMGEQVKVPEKQWASTQKVLGKKLESTG